MKRAMKLVVQASALTIAAALVSCCLQEAAWAQIDIGPVEVTGFGAYLINPNDGHVNPNNLAPIGTPLNGVGNPTFNLMYSLVDLRVRTAFSEHLVSYIEPRFWGDYTNQVDHRWPAYEALPSDFRGDGYMLRGGGNNFKAELWNAYLEYRSGDLLIRVGKQTIAWGEDIGLRVMDQVNPLDLSEQFFFGWAGAEFDDIRIPEWMIRIDKGLPNSLIPNLAISVFASPGTWTPTILPAQGSPYNVVPAVLDLREDIHQGRPIAGFQLFGTVLGRTDFTLNFLTRPTEAPVGLVKGVVPASYGLPGFFFGSTSPLVRLLTEGEHPRFYMIAGSLDTPWDWAGAILRLETVAYTNAAFTNAAVPTKIVTRPQFVTMAGVDRPIYLLPRQAALSFVFQYQETDNAGNLSDVYTNAVQQPTSQHSVILFLDQPLFESSVDVDLLALVDTSEGYWFQPSINWQIGNHWRLTTWWNSFGGAENVRFPGFFWWADGPSFRVMYGF
jgi:Protein of unknown function (DUF1302)